MSNNLQRVSVVLLCLPSFVSALFIVEPAAVTMMLSFVWLAIPFVLAIVVLTLRETAVLIAACIGGILLLPLLSSDITWSMISGALSYVIVTGFVVSLVLRQRVLNERERRAELKVNNEALQNEIAAREYTESALRQSEEAAQQFQQKLITLQEVNIELAQIESFDDLCREAIIQGRARLGFDRLGIWFLDETDPDYMVGAFGTDEEGNLSDERGLRLPVSPKEAFAVTNPTEFPTQIWHRSELYNGEHEVVGSGWNALALLWRKDKVIGILSTDNLIEKRPFSPEVVELLRLYASSLSHLFTRKQAELRAEKRRMMLESVVEMGKEVTKVADLRECLQRIYVSIKNGLDFDRVGLFIYDENHNHLHGTFGTDREGNPREEWDMILPVEFSSPARRPLNADEQVVFAQDFQVVHGKDVLGMAGVKQHVRVVSWVGEKLVAVISADNLPSQRPIQDAQVEALHLFAGYAGLAIANARLLAQAMEAEKRYRSIFENVIEGIFQVDLDGRFVEANPAIAKMFGYERPAQFIEEVKKIGSQIYANAEQFVEVVDLLSAQGQIVNYEFEGKKRDGTHIWLSQNVQSVYDEHGQLLHFEGTAQDITERKQAEEEREALISELEKRNAELERFTYTVSHDLKSPLITIQGFLGFVERDAIAGNTTRIKEDIERISQATNRMKQLLDELLELSRVGRLANPEEKVSYAELVQDALALVSGQLMQAQIEVTVASDLPVVYVDRRRLIEVLQNLLDNAIKFMGDQPHPRIEIGAEKDGAETIFFVRDNGVGIMPEYQETVFGLFERLDQSVEGTGIGLALVKRIIEVHNGRLWVESAGMGQGSTFCFTLPLVDEAPKLEQS